MCPLPRCCREPGRGRETEEITEALVSREARKENAEGIPKVTVKDKYTMTTQQLDRTEGEGRVSGTGVSKYWLDRMHGAPSVCTAAFSLWSRWHRTLVQYDCYLRIHVVGNPVISFCLWELSVTRRLCSRNTSLTSLTHTHRFDHDKCNDQHQGHVKTLLHGFFFFNYPVHDPYKVIKGIMSLGFNKLISTGPSPTQHLR